MAGSVALAVAHAGGSVAWAVPTYRNARPLWRFVEQHAAQVATITRSDMSARFKRGHLTIYTADNDTALRGEAFDLVICDEAAQYRPETWTDVIMPTLADRDGRAILISTPKGKNWFWLEYTRGINKERGYASFNAPSCDNPSPQIRAAYEAAKTRVSERTFLQEWEAQFVDDGGGVFRGIRESATARQLDRGAQGAQYAIGVDWGRTNDATVFVVIDCKSKAVVHLRRMVGTPYAQQRNALKALHEAFNYAPITAELNSMGSPVVEQLNNDGVYVQGFTTTNATKSLIIDELAMMFEQGRITIPADDNLIMELQAYESRRTATGLVTYSAPVGFHDDCVMALALANHAAMATWLVFGG